MKKIAFVMVLTLLLTTMSAFTLGIHVAKADDVTPPQLVGFDFNPKSIDVSGGSQSVAFTLRIVDELSGVSGGYVAMSSPSYGQYRDTGVYRFSGDEHDGFYQGFIEFPQYSESGTWVVNNVFMADNVGNRREYREADLVSIGFPTALSVTGVQAQYTITFGQSGVGSDFAGTVVTVDDRNYATSDLPISFSWIANSVHTYSYASPLTVNSGEQYLWSSANGLSTDQSGSLTVRGSGSITGNYVTQYYLTVQTHPSSVDSPSGQDWYTAGSYASISTTQYVEIVSGSSRYRFNGWATPDLAEITDSSSPSTTVLIDKPKTVIANYVTQYSVSFAVAPTGAGSTIPAGTNVWEDAGPLSLSAMANAGYFFSSWSSSTAYITFLVSGSSSTTATISGSGTVTANFAHKPTTYTVTFTEIGLPSGTSWSVIFNNAQEYSTLSTITFNNVREGTYQWSVATPIRGGTGTQYVTSISSGSMSVPTQTAQSVTFRTQYYLTMRTNFGTTTPDSGWFDAGWMITISATPPSTVSGERYLWQGWNGRGAGSYTGTGNPMSNAIKMQGPVSETASWNHQYLLTVKTNGVPSPYSTTVRLAGSSVGTASDASPFTNWMNAGTSTGTIGVNSQVAGAQGINYVFTSWSDGTAANPRPSLLMDNPRTLVANYQTQYQITFTASGLPPRGPGQTWSVTLDSETQRATGDVIHFQRPAGTYRYTVSAFTGMFGQTQNVVYSPYPPNGVVPVTTANVLQPIKFRATNLVSSNWAGYEVVSNLPNPTSTVTMVRGSWIVQTVDRAFWPSVSSQWIGIGGDNSFTFNNQKDSTLIQVGTASNSAWNGFDYYAWYELLPNYPVRLSAYPVNPGDQMEAMIFLQNPNTNQWSITINDLTGKGWRFSTVVTYTSSMYTAEWIEERPINKLGWPTGSLANFHTATFSSCFATVNGNNVQIGNQVYVAKLDMVNNLNDKIAIAQTSDLFTDGKSFTVTWRRGS